LDELRETVQTDYAHMSNDDDISEMKGDLFKLETTARVSDTKGVLNVVRRAHSTMANN
jgi:hypothetical protein